MKKIIRYSMSVLSKLRLPVMMLGCFMLFNSCKKDEADTSCDLFDLDLFPISKDVALGAEVAGQIAADPTTYPVLDSVKYAAAYKYLYDMRDRILQGGKLDHAADFKWQLRIINDKNTLNAFCTPGGYIYVYTGLIEYLDKADDLAGVLGHEMAHADRRHSTKTLQSQYGISILLQIALGQNPGALATLATNLLTLKYSRCHEAQADEYSVIYLSSTSYSCSGAASFFEKLIATGQTGSTPAFLSTHPGEASRVTAITTKAANLGCSTAPSTTGGSYADFKALLP
ncbi:MAG: M48 family metalloprotease [Bacteroidota bacterium]